MRKRFEQRIRRSASLLAVALAVTTGVTGCGKAVVGYEVDGGTNERSMVSDEPFANVYSTMEYAHDDEVEGTRTQYDESEYASTGATGPAPEEEEGRKWRTILEDVSLVSSPKEGKVLIVVPKGSKVDVLTKKKDGWYKIRYRGTVGYIKSGYFVEDWEEEQAERRAREEAEAKKKAEEAAKKKAEEEARKKAEEEAKKKAEEAARKKAEEEAKKKAEEEAKKKAEEEAKKKAEEEAKKKAEEEAKKKAEEEAKKKAEEEAKKKAEEEAKKKAEEEAKKKAEEEAKKKAAEEAAKKKAEEEAARKAKEEERARAMANGEVTRRMAETVNLRDPDNPDVLFGIVPTGSYVTVLADLGDGWYLVDYDGMEGMIKGGYFTEEDP